MSNALSMMLQGGGTPPPVTGPFGAVPPAQKSDGDWEQDLQNAISALRELEGDATDHQEALVIATCIANLRKLTAQRQAGAESALGIQPAHKAMKRAGY